MKEMASFEIRHVIDNEIKEEINLTGSMTKDSKQRHVYFTNQKIIAAIRKYSDERHESEDIHSILMRHSSNLKKVDRFLPTPCSNAFIACMNMLACQVHQIIQGKRTFLRIWSRKAPTSKPFPL